MLHEISQTIDHDFSAIPTETNNERMFVTSVVDAVQHSLLPIEELDAHYLLDELGRGHRLREG